MPPLGWQTTPALDNSHDGGLALLRSAEGFWRGPQGVLHERAALKRQSLPLLAEHGLGYFDGQPVWLLDLGVAWPLPDGHWQRLRAFMLEGDRQLCRMLSVAEQVAVWDQQHRFCGRCGQPTEQLPGQRCMRCPGCGLDSYARISPSMIVLISRGDELLLGRSPRFVSGMYSVLAGFVEPGETVEACVAREVREEVGIEVRNLQYLGSQSWPFPHSLMLGFHAEYAGGELRIQEDELEDARWFSIDDLPPLPMPHSIARYLIDLHVARRRGYPEPPRPD